MQNWKRFPRIILFLTLLISLLAGLFAPTLENQSASAAPLALNLADTDSGQPVAPKTENRKWIETRLLVLQNKEWVGYSYAWNDEQTDATLVESKGSSRELEAVGHDGSIEEQTWRFPSRSECMVCHSRAAGFVMGVSTPQLNRDHDYHGVVDNQLRCLGVVGLRIADASVMPTITSGNTNAPTLMIAEKAASMMLGGRG